MPDKFPPHTPEHSADSIRENARAKAVRASHEFWSTGNEALLEQAFAETFAEHAVRARHEWLAAKPAPRDAGKGVEMIALKMISEKITAWLRNREAAREWFPLSDPELRAIPIRRSNNADVVRRRRHRRPE